MFLLFGFNIKEMNMTLVPVYLGHFPEGFSTYQLIHYGQLINSGRFCQFDEGPIGNLCKYNSFIPPEYQLEKVSAPVYVFYSSNDLFVSPIDVYRFTSEITNLRLRHLVDDPLWTHIDYIIGIDAKTKVYDYILTNMQNYLN